MDLDITGLLLNKAPNSHLNQTNLETLQNARNPGPFKPGAEGPRLNGIRFKSSDSSGLALTSSGLGMTSSDLVMTPTLPFTPA